MTVERGIVYGGAVLPGTDWVLREPGAWWPRGKRGCRARTQGPPSMLCGHWTAGPPRDGPSAGPRVVRAMDARQDVTQVGVHFVIGWDGLVWQTADLAHATVHAGRAIDERSIGVETCWPGTAAQAARLGAQGATQRVKVAGRTLHAMRPSPELLGAWVRLADALAAGLPSLPRQVPLDRDGSLLIDRMTAAQVRGWRGALEHLHAEKTTKVDAAGYLIGALRDAGWASVPV